MSRTLIHANGHLVCAVDVETTGLKPGYHDIWQVAVVPLDSELRPTSRPAPFYAEIRPRPDRVDPEAMKVGRRELTQLLRTATPPDVVADMFVEWFRALPLPVNKRIIPLATNWNFDHAFLAAWLGWEHMGYLFHGHARDLMTACLHHNDRADFHAEPCPFPKLGLGDLCHALKVVNANPHDALGDAVATAACYRNLCLHGLF